MPACALAFAACAREEFSTAESRAAAQSTAEVKAPETSDAPAEAPAEPAPVVWPGDADAEPPAPATDAVAPVNDADAEPADPAALAPDSDITINVNPSPGT